ncbi:MAG: hypothetical protein QOF65_1739 [Thermoleophilaceae bacterium]|jgi:hypothetical protein|nr:hypothetical protein [Thermoleophilaceae bacterium]MEA2437183.1 hypothetical protein [Thermoleophilaceae bacterium]
MTTLDIAIVVVALLVVLTFVWSMRSERNAPPLPRRRSDVRRGREERDLL